MKGLYHVAGYRVFWEDIFAILSLSEELLVLSQLRCTKPNNKLPCDSRKKFKGFHQENDISPPCLLLKTCPTHNSNFPYSIIYLRLSPYEGPSLSTYIVKDLDIRGLREKEEMMESEMPICNTCGEQVGLTSKGEVFVACHECNYPICHHCFDYDIKEGRNACIRCANPYTPGIQIFNFSGHLN